MPFSFSCGSIIRINELPIVIANFRDLVAIGWVDIRLGVRLAKRSTFMLCWKSRPRIKSEQRQRTENRDPTRKDRQTDEDQDKFFHSTLGWHEDQDKFFLGWQHSWQCGLGIRVLRRTGCLRMSASPPKPWHSVVWTVRVPLYYFALIGCSHTNIGKVLRQTASLAGHLWRGCLLYHCLLYHCSFQKDHPSVEKG